MSATNSVLASTLLAALLLGLGKPSAIAQQIESDGLIAQSSPFQSQTPPINSPYSSSVEPETGAANQIAAGYTLIHVDPIVGNNDTGDGSQFRPFQTITQALQSAEPNSIVLLAPGVYSRSTGESFPLLLKSDVTVQGNPNASSRPVLIQGGGFLRSSSALQRRNATILAADRAGLAHVTITNPTPEGHGLWIEAGSPIILDNRFVGSRNAGIFIAGGGAPVIQRNYFNQNRLAGLIINAPSQAEVRENLFQATGVGITVAEGATPRIVNNRIVHNQDGLVILGNAQPDLEANQISQNRRNGVVEFGASAVASTDDTTGSQLDQAATLDAVSLAEADQSASAAPSQEPQLAQPVTSVEDTAPETAAIAAAAATDFRLSQEPQPAQPQPAQAEVTAAYSPPTLNRAAPTAASAEMDEPVAAGLADPDDEPVVALDAPQAEADAIAAIPAVESSEIPPDITIPSANTSAPDRVSSNLPSITLPAQIPPSISSPVESTTEDSLPTPDQATPAETAADVDGTDKGTDSPRFSALLTRLGVGNLIATGASETPSPSTQSEAIEIPVIYPSTNQADPLDQLAIGSATPASESTAETATMIEIPVIAPPADSEISDLPELPSDAAAPDISERLEVPSSDIPIGNISGLPTISIPIEEAGRTEAPPNPPSRATSLGLYYRVLVKAEDEATQEQIRSLVPDAFRTHFDGQIVMQVGAYEDQASADQLADRLNRNGIEAAVEYIR